MFYNLIFIVLLFSICLIEIQCLGGGAMGGWKEIDNPFLDVEISNIGR